MDATGSTTSTQINGSLTLAGVQAALLAVSNADYVREFEGTSVANGSPSPIAAPFETVMDQAFLWFVTAAGTLVQVTVVAPQSSIFMADGMTVDPTSVAGVVAAVVGTVTDQNGNVTTAFTAGLRQVRN